MKSIFITGSTGFVGKNILHYFNSKLDFYEFSRDKQPIITQDIVLHLAGKAHDIKHTSKPQEYYNVNTEFTKKIFDSFLISNAKVFITLSSVKAVADDLDGELTEDHLPNPITHYGKSKLLAEQYILSKAIPPGKRIYILRPCMIHGPGNKGNLNILYNYVRKGIPWPLGSFNNKRSFCSIYNLCFIIQELIQNEDIPSGVYNISDNDPLSINEIINEISFNLNKKISIWHIPKGIINTLGKIGDFLYLPFNTEKLNKLTQNYIVNNHKIRKYLSKDLPISSIIGIRNTFKSYK